MKIAVIASLTPSATANYLIAALKAARHELFVCSDLASPLADHLASGAVDISKALRRQNFVPELVLFIEGGTMRLFPSGLERIDCLTAWYGIDTHMDYAKHLRIGRLFDVTFIAQQEYVARLRDDGLRQVHWLPLAFAPELMPAQQPQRAIDIAYVGSANAASHPVRHALLATLRKSFASTCFGPATPAEMGSLYASTRIVFNRSVNNDVNMRFFEAAGAGAVLVTDQIIDNGVEALFEEGVHYLTYADESMLLRLVRELLADSERCAAMGAAARQHVLSSHTYAHRSASLLATAKHAVKQSPPQPEDYFAAFLALGIVSAAVRSAAAALSVFGEGPYRQLAGRCAALVLGLMAAPLGVAEWVLVQRRRRR
jgi:hypothetical protein